MQFVIYISSCLSSSKSDKKTIILFRYNASWRTGLNGILKNKRQNHWHINVRREWINKKHRWIKKEILVGVVPCNNSSSIHTQTNCHKIYIREQTKVILYPPFFETYKTSPVNWQSIHFVPY